MEVFLDYCVSSCNSWETQFADLYSSAPFPKRLFSYWWITYFLQWKERFVFISNTKYSLGTRSLLSYTKRLWQWSRSIRTSFFHILACCLRIWIILWIKKYIKRAGKWKSRWIAHQHCVLLWIEKSCMNNLQRWQRCVYRYIIAF